MTQIAALREAVSGMNISWPRYQQRTVLKLVGLKLIKWDALNQMWEVTAAGHAALQHGTGKNGTN